MHHSDLVESVPVHQVSEPPAKTNSLQILLAEDNLVNQRVTHLLVAKLGHTLDIVSDGVMAVEAAERTPYGVVLMDVEMPNMDGLEATRRILSHYRDASDRPYILALTASANRTDCLNAGMDEYLQKPIRLADLGDKLGHALTTAAAWRKQRQQNSSL